MRNLWFLCGNSGGDYWDYSGNQDSPGICRGDHGYPQENHCLSLTLHEIMASAPDETLQEIMGFPQGIQGQTSPLQNRNRCEGNSDIFFKMQNLITQTFPVLCKGNPNPPPPEVHHRDGLLTLKPCWPLCRYRPTLVCEKTVGKYVSSYSMTRRYWRWF